jgi:hypothetical protein
VWSDHNIQSRQQVLRAALGNGISYRIDGQTNIWEANLKAKQLSKESPSASAKSSGNRGRNLMRFPAGLVLAIVAMLLPFSARYASAQLTGTGTIEGTVTDPSGAVISGAKVTAINSATGAQTVRVTVIL